MDGLLLDKMKRTKITYKKLSKLLGLASTGSLSRALLDQQIVEEKTYLKIKQLIDEE